MNKILIAKVVRLLVVLGFVGMVMGVYFHYHAISGGYNAAILNNKGVLVPLLLSVVFLIFGWSLANFVNHNDKVVKWELRPYVALSGLPLLLVVILTIYYAISPFTSSTVLQLSHGAVKDLTWTGMLWAFFSYVVPVLFFLLLLTLFVAGVGYRIFRLLRWKFEERLERMVVGTALGLTTLITIFAVLALAGIFNLWGVCGVILLGVVGVWKSWSQVARDFLWEKITLRFAYDQLTWVWSMILFVIIGFNVIDLIRPNPIGWDDMGVYMNFPRQIALKGSLIQGFPGQAYMLITTLGYMLVNSAMWAMFLSWWGGILALWSLYLLGKRFVSSEAGILMATLMYALPMTMHQSFADMKLDMPLFFFIIVAFYMLFRALEDRSDLRRSYQRLALTGVFFGVALAIKITTALALFPVLILLAWRYGSSWWAGSVALVLHAVYFYQFVLTPDISSDMRFWISVISLMGAVICALVAFWKSQKYKVWLYAVTFLIVGMALVWIPWTYKVLLDTPTWSPSNFITTIFYGGPSSSPQIAWGKIGVDTAACTYTGTAEELGRYIGHEQNLWRKYITVFWDLTMNINQGGFYVDISFLFLGLIPLLVLFWRKKDWSQFWQNVVLCFVLVWYFWLFVGSGVPWYGLAGFLPALLLIVRVKDLAKEQVLWGQYVIPTIIIISLLSAAFLRESRFANTGQMAYAFGILNTQDVLISTNQSYPIIISTLNSDKPTVDSPHYIYRIGTFINYFIDNNRERVYDDAQLDTFRCLDGDSRDDRRTLDRLRQLGFHYIIYDTNTESIERNAQGTLHRKTARFKEFAFKNLKVVAPKDPAQYRNGIVLFEIPL